MRKDFPCIEMLTMLFLYIMGCDCFDLVAQRVPLIQNEHFFFLMQNKALFFSYFKVKAMN